MARTIRTKVFKFNELKSEDAKQKAIESFYDINVDFTDWHEYIIDEFKENETSFDITKVYFSGFWSQGDGAMFEYNGISQNLVNSIIDGLKLPNWKKNVLKHCSYVNASGKHRGHYYHENCCSHSINIERDNNAYEYENIDALIDFYTDEIESKIIEQYQKLCQNLYRKLEKEYEYLTSKEQIIESINANEYEFTHDGRRF